MVSVLVQRWARRERKGNEAGGAIQNSNAVDYSFGKEHRLCGKKSIDGLFAQGYSFFVYPFRCVWSVVDPDPLRETAPVQILISVGKKNHKRAVARNKLKRRIREAYRLNRSRWEMPLPQGKRLIVALIYGSKEILEYKTIEDGLVGLFTELRKRLAADGDRAVRRADQGV